MLPFQDDAPRSPTGRNRIRMTGDASSRSWITGGRVAALGVAWLLVVYLAAPVIGVYYESLAVLYTVPPLGLIYAYCLSHRSPASAALAGVATAVAVLIVGFAIVIPKGSAA